MGWKRKAIVLDTDNVTYGLSGDLTAGTYFLRIAITDDAWSFFTDTTDGDEKKIRFSDSGGNLLNSRVESWDHTGNEAVFIVEQPILNSGSNTTIYIHYGVSHYPDREVSPFPTEVTGYYPLDVNCPWGYTANLVDHTGNSDLSEHDLGNLTSDVAGHGGGRARDIDSSTSGAGLETAVGELFSFEDGNDCHISMSIKHAGLDGTLGVFGGIAADAWASGYDDMVWFHQTDNTFRFLMRDVSAAANITIDTDSAYTGTDWKRYSIVWDGSDETGLTVYEDNSETAESGADSATWLTYDAYSQGPSLWLGFNSTYYNFPANVQDNSVDNVVVTNGLAWTDDLNATDYNNQSQSWVSFGSGDTTAPPTGGSGQTKDVYPATAQCIYSTSVTSWAEARAATSGTLDANSLTVGFYYTGSFYVYRGFVSLDLTSFDLPSDKNYRIDSATFKIYVNSETYDTPRTLYLFIGNHESPLVGADFDYFTGFSCGTTSISGTGSYVTFTINSTGVAYLNECKEMGINAVFAIRDYTYDISSGNPGTASEHCVCDSAGGTNPPYFTLTYRESAVTQLTLPKTPQVGILYDTDNHFVVASTPYNPMPGVYVIDKSSYTAGQPVGIYAYGAGLTNNNSELCLVPTSPINGIRGFTLVRDTATNPLFKYVGVDNYGAVFPWHHYTTTNNATRISGIEQTELVISFLESGVIKTQQSSTVESAYRDSDYWDESGLAGGAALESANTIKTLTGADSYTQLCNIGAYRIVVYTDTVAGNIRLYSRTLDSDGAASGSEVEITGSEYLYSLSSFRVVPLNSVDSFLVVYRGATSPYNLYYAFVDGADVGTAWDTLAELIPSGGSTGETGYGGDGYFSVVGIASETTGAADVIYYDGTDLRITKAVAETWAASSQYVATPTFSDGSIQAPIQAFTEYITAYVDSNYSLQIDDVTLTPDTFITDYTLVNREFGYIKQIPRWSGAYNGKILIGMQKSSGFTAFNLYDVATSTFDLSWTNFIRQFADLAHIWTSVVVDNNGYAYIAAGGRTSFGISENVYIYKSDYTIDNGSFTLDFENDWTDITPASRILLNNSEPLTRGYLRLVVDDSNIVYCLMGGTGALSFWLMEYRSSTWSTPVKIIEYAAGTNIYHHDFILNRETAGQKSLVLTYGQRPAAGSPTLYDLNIIKIIPQGDGTFIAYDLDDVELGDFPGDTPLDYGDGHLVYENPNNPPTANWLEPMIFGRIFMIDEDTPVLIAAMDEPNNGESRVGDTSYYPGIYSFKYNGSTFDRTTIINDQSTEPLLLSIPTQVAGTITDSNFIFLPIKVTDGEGNAGFAYYRSVDEGDSYAASYAISESISGTSYIGNGDIFEASDTTALVVFNAWIARTQYAETFSIYVPFELTVSNIDNIGCSLTFPSYTIVPGSNEVEIHRSETSPVVGDGTTLIADELVGTTYHDESADSGTTYYYVAIYQYRKNPATQTEYGRTEEKEVTTLGGATVGGIDNSAAVGGVTGATKIGGVGT